MKTRDGVRVQVEPERNWSFLQEVQKPGILAQVAQACEQSKQPIISWSDKAKTTKSYFGKTPRKWTDRLDSSGRYISHRTGPSRASISYTWLD